MFFSNSDERKKVVKTILNWIGPEFASGIAAHLEQLVTDMKQKVGQMREVEYENKRLIFRTNLQFIILIFSNNLERRWTILRILGKR